MWIHEIKKTKQCCRNFQSIFSTRNKPFCVLTDCPVVLSPPTVRVGEVSAMMIPVLWRGRFTSGRTRSDCLHNGMEHPLFFIFFIKDNIDWFLWKNCSKWVFVTRLLIKYLSKWSKFCQRWKKTSKCSNYFNIWKLLLLLKFPRRRKKWKTWIQYIHNFFLFLQIRYDSRRNIWYELNFEFK